MWQKKVCLSLYQDRQGGDFPNPSVYDYRDVITVAPRPPAAMVILEVHHRSARGNLTSLGHWASPLPEQTPFPTLPIMLPDTDGSPGASQHQFKCCSPEVTDVSLLTCLWPEGNMGKHTRGLELQIYHVPRRWSPENIWQVSKMSTACPKPMY